MYSKNSGKLNYKLAFHTSLINILGVCIAFGMMIFSIYRQYQQEEHDLVQEKLIRYWKDIVNLPGNGNNVGMASLRIAYYSDSNTSRKPYGLRIANANNDTLLLIYPNKWHKFGLEHADFASLPSIDGPSRLNILNNNRLIPSEIVVYGLQSGNGYLVQILISIEERNTFLFALGRSGFMIAFLIITLGHIASRFVVKRTMYPLLRINDLAEQIILKQTIQRRLPEDARGEFTRLQKNINTMLDVIERQVNRLRDAAIGLGHDIRTPLTRVVNQLELLYEKSDESQRADIEVCMGLIQDIQGLSKQVLDLSEIESGSVRIPRHRVYLLQVLEEVIEMYTYVAEEKGVNLSTKIESSAYIFIEEVRLKQVVGNLLDNAIKFTKQGKQVTLNITQDNAAVYILVSDEGKGIATEDISNIWLPSWRKNTDDQEQQDRHGFGFGLSIVKSIVDAYGGDITLNSDLGGGSTFTITFPVTKM